MRSRARHLLALMLVATALCAERATAATPRDEVVTPVRGLVDRLADGFRRTVAPRPVVRQRCPWSVAAVPSVPVVAIAIVRPPVCPSCLPQPPPSV